MEFGIKSHENVTYGKTKQWTTSHVRRAYEILHKSKDTVTQILQDVILLKIMITKVKIIHHQKLTTALRPMIAQVP